MRSATIEGLDKDLEQLDAAIAEEDDAAAKGTEAADELVAKLKAEGVNPLLDKEAFEQVDAAYKEADGHAQTASELRARRDVVKGRRSDATPKRDKIRVSDFVERFMAGDVYRRLLEANAFESQGTRVEIPGIEILAAEAAVRRLRTATPLLAMDLFAATADVEDFVPIDQRLFPPVPIPVRQVRVTNLVTVSTTDSDQVNYVEETTRTDAAAETAPGTAANEATYVYTERTALVRDIVHFTPAHKRNLADAGQVRGLLEGRLGNGVERRLETQVIQGGGTGQDLLGILETDNIGSISFQEAGHATENILDAIHRAITTVRISLEADPDAIGIHPSPYDTVVTAKAEDSGVYLLNEAAGRTSGTIWGFPAVVTTAFPEETVLVGNYREGAVLWLRSGVSISASDSHEDFFTKRMVALMAELRAAFAAWQPRAFCALEVEAS